jgi:hypothetical protein
VQRKLSVIVSADVVGYSDLMEHDEAGTLERPKADKPRRSISRDDDRSWPTAAESLAIPFGRERPVAAGRAREKRTFADFAARPLAVIDGVTRLRSFRDEGVR